MQICAIIFIIRWVSGDFYRLLRVFFEMRLHFVTNESTFIGSWKYFRWQMKLLSLYSCKKMTMWNLYISAFRGCRRLSWYGFEENGREEQKKQIFPLNNKHPRCIPPMRHLKNREKTQKKGKATPYFKLI